MDKIAFRPFETHSDHDHRMVLFESREEQLAAVVPFLKAGLTGNDRCLCLIGDTDEERIRGELEDRGIDVEEKTATGQLEIRAAPEVYLADGTFDPNEMADYLQEMTASATDEGYDRFRVTGEMGWVADHDVTLEAVRTYERAVERLCPNDAFAGQCQYDRSQFPSEFLSAILESHPHVSDSGEQHLNCYYQPTAPTREESDVNGLDEQLRMVAEQRHPFRHRVERDQSLSLLEQFVDDIHEADTDDIETLAGEAIAEIVGPASISFCRYDRDTGELQPRVLRNDTSVPAADLFDELADRLWEVFVDKTIQEFDLDRSVPVTGVLIPAHGHGSFLIATPEERSFTAKERDLLRTIGGHTAAALHRSLSERELERKAEKVDGQRDRIERLERINALRREVTQSLVDAETGAEIMQVVCDQVVRRTATEFAWFGEYDTATERLRPKYEAGADQGYLEAITLEDDWEAVGPAGRTARTGERTHVQAISDQRPLSHWQQQALKRGFQSTLSVPVCYDNSLLGILSLFSGAPETYDNRIVSVLDELGDCIGYALNSLDRKQALVSEEVVELEIRVTDTDLPVVEFVRAHDCRVDITAVVSNDDEGFRVIVSCYGVDPETVREFAVKSPKISDSELLSERGGSHTWDHRITDQCVMATLLNHNVVPESVTAEDGEAYFELYLEPGKSVRNFVEMLQSRYPSTEIVRRQNHTEPLQEVSSVKRWLEEDLTDRQLETLTLAYHGGYFERPRELSVEDLAEKLDVSHPTVSRHLREAEQRVLTRLLDDD